MKVTVVGAGNIGLAMTAYIAINQRAEVTLFTNKTIGQLRLNFVEKDVIKEATAYCVTSDPTKAFSEADIVFVTYPAFLRKKFIDDNQRFFKEGAFLGFVPGYGGAEYYCTELIKRGISIFGLQRVPYVARATRDESGAVAGILSSKKELFVGTIPNEKSTEAARIIEELLDIPVNKLKEYLSITLAPSNPLLHITGLYNVFRNYK